MDLNLLVNANQSIKIVPSIEDVLRQNGFNADLDSDTISWLNRMKVTWYTWKKSVAVQNLVQEFLSNFPDPFAVVLAVIIKCEDFKDCKPKTLPYCIMEELNVWRQKYNKTPQAPIKLTAFRVATHQRNQDFLNLVVNTYVVKTENICVLPLVRDMIRQGLYKQALQSVVSMDMSDNIPVQDLLFPLVLQDKTTLVDQYLMQCPSQVQPFVLYIDRLLDRSLNIKEILNAYIDKNDVIDVKWDKLYHKPLGKLVARLCNKFKLPIKICANLSKNRTTGGLRYMIYQKYVEKNVSTSAWDDLVKDSLDEYPDAAESFIDMLSEYDAKEAVKWAQYLNIPEDKYPSLLRYKVNAVEEIAQAMENWDLEPGPSQEYYQLSLNPDKIHIIDTGEKFYDFLTISLQNLTMVGIDCEWKPSFVASQSKVALLQIASHHNVYLIDTVVLNQQEYASFWHIFLKKLLDNAEIIKVGFGLEQDLREMKSTLQGFGNLKMKGEGFLDLAVLWKCLSTTKLKLPYGDESGGGSLSCLTQACFGRPLMKQEQCSNWEVRPLRNSQIQYAALDAYVLVQIYTILQTLCRQQNIKFDEICQNIMVEGKQKNSKKNKALEKAQLSVKYAELNRSVSQIKFLVDPNLAHLLPYLRYCGIDSELISATMLWHNVVNLAISDDRCMILSKLKQTPTVNYPQQNIWEVGIGEVSVQLLKVIEHFRIKVLRDNLLTRCMLCNSTELCSVPHNDVQNMYAAYQKSIAGTGCVYSPSCAYDKYSDSNDLNADAFLSDQDSDEDLYQATAMAPLEPKMFFTNHGVAIRIQEVSDLSTQSCEPVLLCQFCGKLYWDGNYPIQNVHELDKSILFCQ